MTYSKQTWVDGVDGGTPLSATRLNYMENGIEAASVANLVTGSGAPSGGSAGDYFLDADTQTLYGPKLVVETNSGSGDLPASDGSSSIVISQKYTATNQIDVREIGFLFNSIPDGTEVRYQIRNEALDTVLGETAWTHEDVGPSPINSAFWYLPLIDPILIPNATSFWVVAMHRSAASPTTGVSAMHGSGSAGAVVGDVSIPTGTRFKSWTDLGMTSEQYNFSTYYCGIRLRSTTGTTWDGATQVVLGEGDAATTAQNHTFFAAGTLSAGETLVDSWRIHDATTETILRCRAYLRDVPTGASATNHVKLVISDGTTSFDLPIDADASMHEATNLVSATTEISQTSTSGATPQNYGRITPFVPGANESIQRISMRFYNSSTSTSYPAELVLLDDAFNILASVAVTVAATGGVAWAEGDFSGPVALTAGATYWVGFRSSANLAHTAASTGTWTGATAGGNSRYYSSASVDFATASGTESYHVVATLYSLANNVSLGPELSVSVVAVGSPPADAGGDLNLVLTTERVI